MIKHVFVENGAEKYALTQDILSRLENSASLVDQADIKPQHAEVNDLDRKSLCLTPFKGEFLKSCPGTKGYICCGYQVLNVGTDCPLDCSYCILQAYFNSSSLKVFINLQEELAKIIERIKSNPGQI